MIQVIAAVTLLAVSPFAHAKGLDPVAERAYIEFCAGRDPAVIKAASGLPELQVRSIKLLTKDGIESEKKRITSLAQDHSKLTEVDRIVFAMAMMMSRSTEFQKIRELLSFKSRLADHEPYRLAAEAQLDLIQGDILNAKRNSLKALDSAKFFEPGIFALATSLYTGDLQQSEFTKRYEAIISSLPNSASRSTAQGHLELARNGWKNLDIVEDHFSSAYISCPRDPGIALDYATLLLGKNQLENARTVLEKVVAYYVDSYSPYVDLMLGEIALRAGRFDDAKMWISRLSGSSSYLDSESKTRVSNLIREIQEKSGSSKKPVSDNKIYFATAFLIAIAVVAFFSLRSSRRSNRSP